MELPELFDIGEWVINEGENMNGKVIMGEVKSAVDTRIKGMRFLVTFLPREKIFASKFAMWISTGDWEL